jgi:hypothetical protein
MADLEQLMSEYKAAHRSGAGADPRPFLERAGGDRERAKLTALIDAYLARAPRRDFDAAAFRDSAATPVAEAVQRAVAGAGGLWPALLPRLRNRARVRRADLVAELAGRLGAGGQQDKVASYYHQMEQGLLPEAGVSDTVLEALGRIVGYSKEALRKAGQMPAAGPPPAAASDTVFARSKLVLSEQRVPDFTPASPPDETWDEVDRLFRGG